MHHHAEIYIPNLINVEKQVAEIMKPYDENTNDSENAFWDWYQIGGRWKGVHDPKYSQENDPEHKCHGTGMATTWPTTWKPHPKDIIPISDITDSLEPYTLIINGKVFHKEKYITEPDTFGKFVDTPFTIKDILNQEGIKNGYLVTIDYHG